MAGWRVIERSAQTLARLLEQKLSQVAISGVQVRPVSATSFSELAATKSPVISLFLYQVVENPERRNALPQRRGNGPLRRQPLALELCYLVTPWGARKSTSIDDDTTATLEEARLLGLILQAFYDKAELGTADLFEDPLIPVWHAGDNLQVVLESLPVEDHYRIWDASELGYRLSVTYRIRVAFLDSSEDTLALGVTEATFNALP